MLLRPPGPGTPCCSRTWGPRLGARTGTQELAERLPQKPATGDWVLGNVPVAEFLGDMSQQQVNAFWGFVGHRCHRATITDAVCLLVTASGRRRLCVPCPFPSKYESPSHASRLPGPLKQLSLRRLLPVETLSSVDTRWVCSLPRPTLKINSVVPRECFPSSS